MSCMIIPSYTQTISPKLSDVRQCSTWRIATGNKSVILILAQILLGRHNNSLFPRKKNLIKLWPLFFSYIYPQSCSQLHPFVLNHLIKQHRMPYILIALSKLPQHLLLIIWKKKAHPSSTKIINNSSSFRYTALPNQHIIHYSEAVP